MAAPDHLVDVEACLSTPGELIERLGDRVSSRMVP
jgi:hypothetical protein